MLLIATFVVSFNVRNNEELVDNYVDEQEQVIEEANTSESSNTIEKDNNDIEDVLYCENFHIVSKIDRDYKTHVNDEVYPYISETRYLTMGSSNKVPEEPEYHFNRFIKSNLVSFDLNQFYYIFDIKGFRSEFIWNSNSLTTYVDNVYTKVLKVTHLVIARARGPDNIVV
ncbi:MAG: hypothetical protein ACOCT9_02370 [archaeon]